MRITVVTIVYNDVRSIERTLLSVLGQTANKDIEYIVVDGASTDGTSEIIKRYTDRISKYICEPDTGIYNAMNKGLSSATGDYVQFINSGDAYSSPTVVEEIIASIDNKSPEVAEPFDIVYGNYREIKGIHNVGTVIPCRNADKIWYGPIASHQSMLYRVSHLRDYGICYDETYRIAADYKLTAQAVVSARCVLKTDICISDFDISGVSSTNQNQGLAEANRVRKEVFRWGKIRIAALSAVLLFARYTKRYCNPIYQALRH